MTPTEKAKELFSKFNAEIPIEASFSDSAEYAIEKMKRDHLATKQCALICVDKMIIELEDIEDGYRMDRVDYWQEVKQEIQKL